LGIFLADKAKLSAKGMYNHLAAVGHGVNTNVVNAVGGGGHNCLRLLRGGEIVGVGGGLHLPYTGTMPEYGKPTLNPAARVLGIFRWIGD
jgi:hypothetical protein